MIKHILTACAVAAAGAAGISIAHAQQSYPLPPGAIYAPAAPQPYPQGGYPAVDIHAWRRYSAALPKLPDLLRRVRQLERALNAKKES